MSHFKTVRNKRQSESGQTMTEYSLILATVAVVIISLYDTAGSIITALVGHVGPLL
jgi:Flp pilus assembly pilin Flp